MSVNKLPKLKKQHQENINSPMRLHSKKTFVAVKNWQYQFIQKFQSRFSNISLLQQRLCNKEQNQTQKYASALIFGKVQYDEQDLANYLRQLHQSLIYSSLVLGLPSDEVIKQKQLILPELQSKKGLKFLMLDLDETLIHVVQENQPFQVELEGEKEKIRMNIRPFCQNFLENMNEHYQIYVFTSAAEQQAKPIVQYLNANHHYIQGILSRQNCLATRSGVMIKDLRIIKNKDLSQIVIVDNMAHSFGLQIQNGIPILDFVDRKNDKQLLGIQKLLVQLKDASDVREFLRKKLNLKKCCQIPEDQFIKSAKIRNTLLKKRKTFF